MSKADVLLKRATFFERMALYSDRKSFLRAIAQDLTSKVNSGGLIDQKIKGTTFSGTFGDDVRQQAESVIQDLTAFKVDPSIISTVQTALNTATGVDKEGLIRALQAATSKYPPNGAGQLQNLQSLIAKLSGPAAMTPEQQDDAAGGEHVTMPADHIRALPPINTLDQASILKFVQDENLDPDGKILPTGKVDIKDIDGKLGKQTRSAIEAVKNYFARSYPNNPRMTDQQAMTAAKAPKRR